MKYVSIDIETTGLDREKHQVLSIGAIIEDTTKKLSFEEIPKFYGLILHREIIGSPRALTMNKDLIEMIGTYIEGNENIKNLMIDEHGKIFYEEDKIIPDLYRFFYRNGLGDFDVSDFMREMQVIDGISYPSINGKTKPIVINVAGKNFGTFDKLFLEKLTWFKKLIYVRQRIIDPAILHCDWNNDEFLPSLEVCKERSGFEKKVSHNALEDAWDVITVLRKFY